MPDTIEIDRTELAEETALAMAQATIQGALNAAAISRADLARLMNRPRSFVTRFLRGDHNLTVKTLARALHACGFEVEFVLRRPEARTGRHLAVVWGQTTQRVQRCKPDGHTPSGLAA